MLCAIATGWLGAQPVRGEERPAPVYQNLGSTTINGYVNTSVGWRWHMCVGPFYALPIRPNGAGRLFSFAPGPRPPAGGVYVRCPHGLMLVPPRQIPARPFRTPPPPRPTPGSSIVVVPLIPPLQRTNPVPVLPPPPGPIARPVTSGGFISLDSHPDNGYSHTPDKPHPPHPGDPNFPPGQPPGHGPGTNRPRP